MNEYLAKLKAWALTQDKAMHVVVAVLLGLLNAGLFAVQAALAPQVVAAHPLMVMTVNLALIVGLVKELNDRLDNLRLARMGQPPLHNVEAADVGFTVFGGVICASLLLWLGWA